LKGKALPQKPSQALRVMQVCAAPKPGGAEKFFVRLCEALAQRPAEEVVVLPVVRPGSWVGERLAEAGVPVETVPFGSPLEVPARLRLKALAKQFRPDVIQTWMNRASSLAPRGQGVVVGRLGGYYKLKNYKRCDWLVGNTEDICRYLREEGWPESRLRYLPNFVTPPRAADSGEAARLRERFGIPKDASLLFLAGRLHENKAIDVAIKALAQLADQTHLLIAGEGPLEAELKALAESEGVAVRCHFTDWLDDLAPCYAAADIALVPSRIEPLGNVVLEAWGAGLPVVASKSAGPVSLIEEGESGLLFELEDAQGLAGAVRRLQEDPQFASRLADKGRETLETRFSKDAVVDRFLAFYREISGAG